MQESFEKLAKFFFQYKKLSYKKHEIIIRADDTPSGVYFLKKGYVRVYSLSEGGQELNLIILKPQDFFPMIWAMTDSPNTQYCETITAVELYRVPRRDFLAFLINNPDVVSDLLKNTLIRFEGLLERMEYLVFGNAYQKVASILVICAERFGLKKEKKIIINVPLTHKDVASLIGLTRETTSVELKKLENENLIYKKGGRIIVRNMDRLKEAAQWYKFV